MGLVDRFTEQTLIGYAAHQHYTDEQFYFVLHTREPAVLVSPFGIAIVHNPLRSNVVSFTHRVDERLKLDELVNFQAMEDVKSLEFFAKPTPRPQLSSLLEERPGYSGRASGNNGMFDVFYWVELQPAVYNGEVRVHPTIIAELTELQEKLPTLAESTYSLI